MKEAPRLALDTETTGLNSWIGDVPFAVSACSVGDEELFYWEWPVDPFTREVLIPEKERKEVQKLIDRDWETIEFWNAKFDIFMLGAVDIHIELDKDSDCPGIGEVSYMARSCFNDEFAYALKPLSKKYIQFPDDDLRALKKSVVAARRIGKKMGWVLADDVEADYWMPEAVWRLHPELAKEKGILKGANKQYALNDAIRTARLSQFYRYGMDHMPAGVKSTYEMEMQLLPYTFDMERLGVRIDGCRVRKIRRECELRLAKARRTVVEATGNPDFNLNSPKQVVDMLFEGKPLKLKPLGKTKGGGPSTKAENVVPYRKTEPLVEALLEWRSTSKALTSFFRKYRTLSTRGENGDLILHPGYKQWGAKTGRYACSEPNLQAVSDPKNTNSRAADLVIDIRQTFGPPEGYRWYAPDYDQVEVIIFADISKEPTMLAAIKNGTDIHSATANKVWGGGDNRRAMVAAQRLLAFESAQEAIASTPELERFAGMAREKLAHELLKSYDWDICALEDALGLKTYRKLAKTVTFTKIFGGGYKALMGWLGIGAPEAKSVIADYDESFPDIAKVARAMELLGKEQGYIENPFGRRLAYDRWAPYVIVNHDVQSAAADLIKRGMLKCARYLRSLGIDARIVMTVHDEIIFQIREDHCFKSVLRRLCFLMSDHEGVFSVPTPASMERIDERWSEKVKVTL